MADRVSAFDPQLSRSSGFDTTNRDSTFGTLNIRVAFLTSPTRTDLEGSAPIPPLANEPSRALFYGGLIGAL